MKFEQVKKEYVPQCLSIAEKAYKKACEENSQLIKEDFKDQLNGLLEALFETGLGMVALEDEKVVGYLAFFGPIEGFHGLTVGAFSPLGGSCFTGEERGKMASRLFEKVGSLLVKKGIGAFAVSYYCHDEMVKESFVLNGFGIRCSDAIMKLADRKLIDKRNDAFTYTELVGEDKERVLPLAFKLAEHLNEGPTFYPSLLDGIKRALIHPERHLFVARKKRDNEIVGYINAEDDESETFITTHEKMANICGAYVLEAYRGSKVADSILDYACESMQEKGNIFLGVDYETLNPTALRFWTKHFAPYTYSYYRRLDERTQGWEDYYKDFIQKIREK